MGKVHGVFDAEGHLDHLVVVTGLYHAAADFVLFLCEEVLADVDKLIV